MKNCPRDKIYNPLTERCININGATYKKLVNLKIIKSDNKKCPENKILNTKSNRCVSVDSNIGKKIVLKYKFLDWEKNSCYIDSLFLTLFYSKNKFIKNEILKAPINDHGNSKLKEIGKKIKIELIKIYKRENINTCTNIRKLFENYYKLLKIIKPKFKLISSNDNWISSQLDVFELLELLTTIFKIKNTTKIIDANNPAFYSNFVNMIPIDFLMTDQLHIENIYPSYETTYKLSDSDAYIDSYGIKHTTYIKKTEILKAPYLMIRISRNFAGVKSRVKVIPPAFLKLKENKSKLYLSSMIIHYGTNRSGHYISLIKIDDIWYEYDDIVNKFKIIGTLKDIIANSNYTRGIVGLIYE